MRWWTRAAIAGDTLAQFNLGVMLVQWSDPPELEEARLGWTLAAHPREPSGEHHRGQSSQAREQVAVLFEVTVAKELGCRARASVAAHSRRLLRVAQQPLDRGTEGGIVDRLHRVRAEIGYVVTRCFQVLDQKALQFVTRMVRSDRDARTRQSTDRFHRTPSPAQDPVHGVKRTVG